jgi:hypothetical protein
MTVSANPTPQFTRDQILTAAIRMTGILEEQEAPSAALIASATNHLTFALQDLQSSGIILRTAERAMLPLVNGQSTYALPSDTIDLELGQDDTVGNVVPADGSAETIVKTMARGEYMNVALKNILSGHPSRVYVERLAVVSVIFWPIPDSSTLSFRYTRIRLLRAADTGAANMDLSNVWTPYLVYSVASGVALDKSKVELSQALLSRAQTFRQRAEAGDVQHGNIRFRVGHRARNW